MNEQIEIFREDQHLWTTSLDVAEKFKKKHKNVLQAYEKVKEECSEKFNGLNFQPVEYTDAKGEKRPMLKISRGGFSMLVMSFTGKKATRWKESYISAFDAMEQEILRLAKQAEKRGSLEWQEQRRLGKVARRVETDTIKDFVEYATKQGSRNASKYYINLTKMTYRALSMIEQGLKAPNGLRDLLNGMQLSYLNTAEYIAANALAEGMDSQKFYKDIYQFAKQKVVAFASTVKTKRVVITNKSSEMQLTT